MEEIKLIVVLVVCSLATIWVINYSREVEREIKNRCKMRIEQINNQLENLRKR